MNPKRKVFQHDNASCHCTKLIKNWLVDQSFFVINDWPSKSQDLNPIENLCLQLKSSLNKYEKPPNGLIELWERVQDEWGKINKESCKKLIESMPNRILHIFR